MTLLSESSKDWQLISTTIRNFSDSRSRLVNLGRKFSSPYLIVRVSTKNQPDTWSFGGKLWASYLVLGKQAKFYQFDLDLFEQEFLPLPKYFEGKYSLLYQAPKYFRDVTLKVWQYAKKSKPASLVVDLSSIEAEIVKLQDSNQEQQELLATLISQVAEIKPTDGEFETFSKSIISSFSEAKSEITAEIDDLRKIISKNDCSTASGTETVTFLEDEFI